MLGIVIPVYIANRPLTLSGGSRMGEGMLMLLLIILISFALAILMSIYAYTKRLYVAKNTMTVALSPLYLMMPFILLIVFNE